MKTLVFDTETTSTADDRQTCELAWVEVDESWNILNEVQSLIDPGVPISPSASGIHGLVDEDVKDAPTIQEFFSDPTCYGKRLQGPIILVGHRIGFDRPAIEPFVDGEILEIDTLRYARQMYPDSPDHKLATLVYLLDLPRTFGKAHSALNDVMWAYHLAKHIATRLGMTPTQLAEHAKQPFEVRSLSFGKHRGEPLSSVPKSYLRWLVGSDMKLDVDTEFTVKRLLGARDV